jgi:hypothetical protein
VHLLGTPAGTGPLSSVSASSTTLMNSKGLHSKSGKPGIADDGLGLNGAFSGSGCAGGADYMILINPCGIIIVLNIKCPAQPTITQR